MNKSGEITSGIKPGGLQEVYSGFTDFSGLQDDLNSLKLESHVGVRFPDLLEENLHASDGSPPTLRNPGYHLFFWQSAKVANPEALIDAYFSDERWISIDFFGYPACDFDDYKPNESSQKFEASLRERIEDEGLPGIEHLVGVRHIPHSIDCQPTKDLGYAEFLKKNAPDFYESRLRYLVYAAGMKVNPETTRT